MNALAPAPAAPRLRPLTPKELSAMLGGLVTPATICRWCRLGKLPLVKKGRPYLISPVVLTWFRKDISHLVVAA